MKDDDVRSASRTPALAVVLALFLPWVWAAFFVPVWVSITTALIALVLFPAVLGLLRPSRAAITISKEEAAQVSGKLHQCSDIADRTNDDLHDVRAQIHGVMEQTERAVLTISDCFRNITSKTNAQMEAALRLLRSTHGVPVLRGEHTDTGISIPEYVYAVEMLVNELTDELARAGAESESAAARSARLDLTRLSEAVMRRNQEVLAILDRMHTLGEEVRQDIHQIVVNLQFQDITHQKLERVKTPLLNELGRNLQAIAEETRRLYQRLFRSLVGKPAEAAPRESAAKPAEQTVMNQSGNKVELF